MSPLTALRYEAQVLRVPYRKLLMDLRQAGALARDPGGRGHTVYRGWEDKFRARMFYRTILCESGGSFHRMVSVIYCTRAGQRWLRDFVEQQAAAEPAAVRGGKR